MTERIRSLLDRAIEDVRPRLSEPGSELTRRGQASQRRMRALTAMTAAAVAVITATGGVMIAGGGSGSQTPAADPSTDPKLESAPTVSVEVIDGEVRAGGLVLPVPPGWQVIRDKKMDYCDVPDKTILINTNPIPGSCNAHNQISIGAFSPIRMVNESGWGSGRGQGVNELVASGGAPVRLTENNFENVEGMETAPFAVFAFDLPWSRLHVNVEMNTADVDRILGAIRIEPVDPGLLVLPESATRLYVEYPGRPRQRFEDPNFVGRVLEQLRAADRPVGAGELPCGQAEPLLASWAPAALEMINLVFTDASGTSLGTVAVSRDANCAFATSLSGGRVWLAEDSVNELITVFSKGQTK
jgi:hypothetical protein